MSLDFEPGRIYSLMYTIELYSFARPRRRAAVTGLFKG